MGGRLGCAFLALTLAGCAPALRPTTAQPPQSAVAINTVPGLAAAIAAIAKRADHATDAKTRAALAQEASADAAACLALEPQAAACLYGHAIATGLQARAHPTQANELLRTMLDSLTQAESADVSYDHAGPARVKALVLLRAPGWPLGPGDAEAGLLAARRAQSVEPSYPPNLLALAEALSKSGDSVGAQQNYERARTAASALAPGADRDDWLRQADTGLRNH